MAVRWIVVMLAIVAGFVASAFADPGITLGSRQMRTTTTIHKLLFSDTGDALIASDAEEAWAWNPKTGEVLFRFVYPPKKSLSLGRLISPTQLTLVVTDDADNGATSPAQVAMYDAKTEKLTIVGKLAHPVQRFDSAAIAPDGLTVAYSVARGEASNSLVIQNGKTGNILAELPMSLTPTDKPIFSNDGEKILIANEKNVSVYRSKGGERLQTLDLSKGPFAQSGNPHFSNLLLSPDSKWVAASIGKSAEKVVVWELATGRVLHKWKASKALGFTPDGTALAATTTDAVVFWNIVSGKKSREIEVAPIEDVTMSPDGSILVAYTHNAAILYDAKTGAMLPHSSDPPGIPAQLSFAPDGALVGKLTKWGGWVRWDAATKQGHKLRPVKIGASVPLSLSADSRTALYHLREKLFVRDLETGRTMWSFPNPSERDVAAMSLDGKIVVAAEDAGVAVFETTMGTQFLIRSKSADRTIGNAMAITPDGQFAAVAAFDSISDRQKIEIYDTKAKQFLRGIPLDDPVLFLAFSPDGRRLVAGCKVKSNGGEVQYVAVVYDASNGRETLRIKPGANNTTDKHVLAFSADSRILAHVDDNVSIGIWELASGKPRATIPIKAAIHAVAIRGDGRTVAISSAAGPVAILDATAGMSLAKTPTDRDRLWDELAGESAVAYRAAIRMQSEPAEAVEFLKRKLPPAAAPDLTSLTRWIDDLDAPAFAVRDRAMRELKLLGELAEPTLMRVLQETDSVEVKERIEILLADCPKLTPDAIRILRAIELLEWIGTPEVKAVLKKIASGAEGAKQTREAVATLSRMGK